MDVVKFDPHLLLNRELGDLERMWSYKPMRIALLGLLIIPLVYSLIYLTAFYDPYDNLANLPVALVNEDNGVIQNGEKVEIGKELVEKLQKDKKVHWELVSRSQMEEGFRQGSFSLGIVIPADFSERVVSLDQPSPAKSELIYYSDQASNYLTSLTGNSIKRELEDALETSLTQLYVENVFTKLGESAKELQKASDGADKLASSTQLVVSKVGQMSHGVQQIEQGAEKIQSGHQQLILGLTKMRDEMSKARQQMDEPLMKVYLAQKRVHQINDAIQKLAKQPLSSEDFTNLNSLNNANAFLQQSHASIEKSQSQIESLLRNHPELKHDPNFNQLIQSLEQASVSVSKTQQSWQRHENEWRKITDQLSLIVIDKQKIAQESQRMTQLFDQKVLELEQMVKGVDQLIAGANQLIQGAEKLEYGQEELIAGIRQLGTGAAKLQNGLNQIAAGQSQLADGLAKGVSQANQQLEGSDKKSEIMADPVQVKDENLHPVPNYATGMAPYFISLSLWVGSMLLFTAVDLYGVLKNKPYSEPLSLPAAMLIGSVQAVILSSALSFFLHLNPKMPIAYILFPILMALTFAAINHLLVSLFGNAGRFLAIVILMLQLASSGGTYPVELLPEFFQKIHPYLPMTYTVHGLRAILSSGNETAVMQDVNILLVYMLGAAVITYLYLYCLKPYVKQMKYKQQTV